ncbi:enoyl-CoA hydratase/carnithine racemase [Bacillus oleivorans]|uniref:Enoyl-CoA hydratase/carnithine racemase n=1 Tax=Bacillus oleivorans TaxID=1448271 RepID=A0A285CR65_9BACI|nr:enoyl-CoA hydratase-related protein [Bacillus oleivorans]SNX69915.1 enoyl-CoA hydratase/carnithine racemase [Bacillus oleivorans]
MKNLLLEINNGIGYVTLNRPEALNCFNYETLVELGDLVESIRFNSSIRVVVFTGAGEKAFSTGADLKERKTLTEDQVRRNVYKIRSVFQAVADLPQPTIAAVNGYAFGGGFELMLACDFRIAIKEAVMALTEVSWAIIPGAGGTQRLPRLIGEARAKELILTARKINAETAYSYGLLTKVVEREELMLACEELANEMLKHGPIAIQQAKFAIQKGMNADLATGLDLEAKAYEVLIPTQDRIEALEAFAEKRPPNFQGK